MADKSLLLALASSERGGSKPKINTFYIQSLRFLLVQSLLLREAPYIPKHSFIHSFIHSLHYITLHYITLREDIILYLVMVSNLLPVIFVSNLLCQPHIRHGIMCTKKKK